MAEAIQNAGAEEAKREMKEITLKFTKGFVGRDFQGKDGNSYKEIRIPNEGQDGNRIWQSFVVKANHVHEDQYDKQGKTMWLKVPAEGSTTLQHSVVTGETPDGRKEWGTEKTTVTNAELKKMIDAVMEKSREAAAAGKEAGAEEARREITLKITKGLVGDEFQGKDGNSYKEIRIPNEDQNGNRKWQSFVVRANRVHEDQYDKQGKTMWLKVPAEGSTTLQRSVVTGETPDGRKEWGTEKTIVTNAELKKMIDAVGEKTRSSVTEKLAEKKTEAAERAANTEPREKERSVENTL